MFRKIQKIPLSDSPTDLQIQTQIVQRVQIFYFSTEQRQFNPPSKRFRSREHRRRRFAGKRQEASVPALKLSGARDIQPCRRSAIARVVGFTALSFVIASASVFALRLAFAFAVAVRRFLRLFSVVCCCVHRQSFWLVLLLRGSRAREERSHSGKQRCRG